VSDSKWGQAYNTTSHSYPLIPFFFDNKCNIRQLQGA
jgi:hypothetical protein